MPIHSRSQRTRRSRGWRLALGALASLLVRALDLVRAQLKHLPQHLQGRFRFRRQHHLMWRRLQGLDSVRPQATHLGNSKAHRQHHRVRWHLIVQGHRSLLAHPRLRSLLLLRLRSGVVSLHRQQPPPAGFHSPQVVGSHSVSRVQRQLQRQIHLLLLPLHLAEVLYLPSVLLLSLMEDKSRSFLVVELGDANRLRDLSFW